MLVVGNWKMHGSLSAVREFAASWTAAPPQVRVAIAPPFPYLAALAEALPEVGLSAQDCSSQPDGARTGEVAASMLADLGCQWVIIGHSERRQYHGEAEALIAAKVSRALAAGLWPILCVGETLSQRESGEHEQVVASQLLGALAGMDVTSVVVAYEPVWAIGTGLTATPEQAEAMHCHLRQLLRRDFGDAASAVPLLYGGSVKPDNAAALFACENIDGALVGGASLKAADFAAIVGAAV